MRPPRLVLLAFCLIFLPIFLTLFSALSSSSQVATPNAIAGPTTGLHALFSFNIPSSLFPPSAIISLTDDNSTFFLARPAAFGPLLPEKGLSGQLWVGGGFGDGSPAAGVTGELGCSDIPGWKDGDTHRQDRSPGQDKTAGKSVSGGADRPVTHNLRRTDSQSDPELQRGGRDQHPSASTKDGTDDHLHHPFADPGVSEKRGESSQARQDAHADIQSLQESAEIAGKVVLLSRGGCGFLEKAKWVQRRGGTALIVGDDTRGGGLITMYARGDTSNVTIPSLFTSHTTAQLLSSLVPPQSREDPSQSNGSKTSSRTSPSSQSSVVKHLPTSSASVAPTPTGSPVSVGDEPLGGSSKPKSGIFHGLLSLMGIGAHDGQTWPLPEDSRRPPSSGNIDWVVLDSWDEEETLDELKSSADLSHSRSKSSSNAGGSKKSGPQGSGAEGDGFVIGVQDWRDPDVLSPKNSATAQPTRTMKSQINEKTPSHAPTSLKGGSRTPGSGEYRDIEYSGEDLGRGHPSMAAAVQSGAPGSGTNWFSRHFAWTEDKDLNADKSSTLHEKRYADDTKTHGTSSSQNHRIVKSDDHEGLWVTLTPTSMSTSPFFDTLLVLVVSPLVTLTVVYALLLLRARIRRRRWRAPKSVVERLPVRTYHTIASSSSSSSVGSAGSTRSASPGSALPTSPLLGSRNRSRASRSKTRSRRMSGVFSDPAGPSSVESSNKEKPASRPSLWKRKYNGRQVECVVCLEEYVNGQSRVMSLPCGHEFHAECM